MIIVITWKIINDTSVSIANLTYVINDRLLAINYGGSWGVVKLGLPLQLINH